MSEQIPVCLSCGMFFALPESSHCAICAVSSRHMRNQITNSIREYERSFNIGFMRSDENNVVELRQERYEEVREEELVEELSHEERISTDMEVAKLIVD